MEVLAAREIKPGHKLLLQDIGAQDYDMLLRWFTHADVAPHLAGVPQTTTAVQQYYAEPALHAKLAINEVGKPVGVFGFRDPETEDGYATLERFVVNPDMQSNGIGTAMIQEAIAYAFGCHNHQSYEGIRLRVGMGVANDEDTVRFYEKAGFITETILHGEKKIGKFSTVGEAMTYARAPRRVIVTQGNGWEVTSNKTQMVLSKETWENSLLSK